MPEDLKRAVRDLIPAILKLQHGDDDDNDDDDGEQDYVFSTVSKTQRPDDKSVGDGGDDSDGNGDDGDGDGMVIIGMVIMGMVMVLMVSHA